MIFKHNGIEFDICDDITIAQARELYSMLPTKDVPIFQVDIEMDDDELLMYIYIENDNKDYWSKEAYNLCETLKARGYDACMSDEDYDCDVIIVDLTVEEHLHFVRVEIWKRGLRVCPECGEREAHMVSGQEAFGERIEQFHCQNCHYTWVGYPNGEFIREGVLRDF